ncbi:MAG: hypothetical protein M9936_27250 [Caldilinea sp.]|nr:hypothetical protein [Caldilinea sp.]MCB0057257.1 hypothetical protein [Caldilineaceae bacterium]MCB0050425.1 hypothetical protein [Caldilinea sp.]MCB0135633.1 hypothetical protein [Caldilineaceae bacterium]MCO5213416.1 hypothetical protein [Caldilinea sp.]
MVRKIGTTYVSSPDRALHCEIPEHLQGGKFRATWVTYKERSLWCCDFSGFETDHQGLLAEIEMSDTIIRQQPEASLLAAVVLYKTKMTPEIKEFFRVNSVRPRNPLRKIAILYVSDFQRLWYRSINKVYWPNNTKFFNDYEAAKEWLVRGTS